ncbi:hypothetical protein HK104_005683, partial [Borealophlyctis nickersoniae]
MFKRKVNRPDPKTEVAAGATQANADTTTAKDCLDYGERAPFEKRSLLDPIQHMPSKLSANVTDVSEKARRLTHGVKAAPQPEEREAARESIYHRREHQPLGRAAPTGVRLPAFTYHPLFRFGMCEGEDVNMKEILYPNIPDDDSNEEIRRRYVLSHCSYQPGERRKPYGANWVPPLNAEDAWLSHGSGSRHNNDGHRVHDALYWITERKNELGSITRSKRQEDWEERHHPKIGQVHDPIKDTMSHLPPDHAFGITFKPDAYSVGELLGSDRKDRAASAKRAADRARIAAEAVAARLADPLPA